MEIKRARIEKALKEEILNLLFEIEAHELFFTSFSEKNTKCRELRDSYSSEEAFLYEVYECAAKCDDKFLLVCRDNRGLIRILNFKEYADEYPKNAAYLSLDVCEHTYFLDYGFDRDRYLKNSISHLCISKLAKTQVSLDNCDK